MNSIEPILDALLPYAEQRDVAKRTVLLREGEYSNTIYFVRSGCLRSWFNQDGKDVSFQFFMPGTFLTSFESMMFDEPSPYTIESVLPSSLYTVDTKVFKQLVVDSPELKDQAFQIVCERLRHYQRLFLSRIKDTPEQRYKELTKEYPELIRNIPQHYIASYLGITSVSLSRIRCRK